MKPDDVIVDYTEQWDRFYPNTVLLAQGKGRMFRAIVKVRPEDRVRVINGSRYSFLVYEADLSISCKHEKDQAWACVQVDDRHWVSRKELRKWKIITSAGKPYKDTNLFTSLLIT